MAEANHCMRILLFALFQKYAQLIHGPWCQSTLEIIKWKMWGTLGHPGRNFGERSSAGSTAPQVLMWRTNFDTKSYQDVLRQHSRRSSPDPPPHLTDIHPRGPHLHLPQPSTIEVSSISLHFKGKGIWFADEVYRNTSYNMNRCVLVKFSKCICKQVSLNLNIQCTTRKSQLEWILHSKTVYFGSVTYTKLSWMSNE